MVDEAVRTITEEGIESLTLRGSGCRLGVSRTALPAFLGQAALLAAVARDGFQKFRVELESAWEQGAGHALRLHAHGRGLHPIRRRTSQPLPRDVWRLRALCAS